MKLQLDIPENINYHMKLEKAEKRIASLQDLVLMILHQRYLEVGV